VVGPSAVVVGGVLLWYGAQMSLAGRASAKSLLA